MEKTVAVKLTARTTQYMAAMASASKATEGLATSASGLTKVGSSMQSVGANMTRYVSVPLVALGGAATLMASRFETSFAQMVGLANVPASEVDHLRESVLSLAGETARGPQELADALYLAASSGLDSADAMDVVTLAAKGAAAGMGSTSDVVNLLTGAVGSYGQANLTAAEAADFLSATIREGRAAPEELATTMGRILPIAASMGISMGEVGGALAFLTNTGQETDQAVTGLRDALVKLSNPGAAAQQVLEDMGTSSGELQQAISQDGLMGALELLRDHGFAGNTAALNELMPDIRGLNAILPLLADNTGTLDGIMGRVTDSAGSLGTAFGAVADTDAFKLKQAFADIQVALIQVGGVLLPFVADAAKAILTLVGWFSDLPAPIQEAAVAFAALAAAGGPVVFMAGTLMKSWGLLNQAFGATLGSTSKVVSTLSGIAVAAGVAYAAWKILDQGHLNATGHIEASAAALQTATENAWAEAAAAAGATGDINSLAVAHQALGVAILEQADDRLSGWFAALNVDGGEALDVLLQLKDYSYQSADSQEWLANRLGLSTDAAALFQSTVMAFGFSDQDITQEMRDTLGMTDDQIMATRDAILGLNQYALEGSNELDNMARATLDATVALGGTGKAAVLAAEGIAGSRLETGNAVPVYEEYIHQLSLIDPEAAAAALSVTDLGGAVGTVTDSVALWSTLWSGVPKLLGGVASNAKEAALALGALAPVVDTNTEAIAELARIAATGPSGEALVQYAEGVTTASRSGNDAILVYQAMKVQLHNLAEGFPEVYGQLGLTANAFDKVSGVVSDAKAAVDDLHGAYSKVPPTAAAAAAAAGEFGAIMANTQGDVQSAADAMYAFTDAVSSAMGALTSDPANLARAQLDVIQGFADMADAVDTNGTSLDANTQGGHDNITMLYDQADAIIRQSQLFLENGYSVGQVSASYTSYRDQLIAAAEALGLNQDEVNQLLTLYGLTPELVTTAFDTVGTDEAKRKTQELITKYGGIPTSIYTEVSAAISAGDYDRAYNLLSQLDNPLSVPVTPYLTVSNLYVGIHAQGVSSLGGRSAAGRFVPGGSNFLTTTAEIGGRRGDEVILPLGDKARMSALLGMSEVGPRVAAAFGGSGGSGGGMSTAVYNIYNSNTVNMPPGANGDDVIRALRKWQRQSGPLPLLTR